MDMSRRSMLAALAGVVAGAACDDRSASSASPTPSSPTPWTSSASAPEPAKTAKRGVVYGGGSFGTTPERPDVFKLGAIDIDRLDVYDIDLTFLAHGFAPHPSDSRRGAWFEKQGPGACEIDMRDRKVVRHLKATAGRQFYGHGAFSRDGATLFVVESHVENFHGAIVVRDGKTYEVLGELPTFGTRPHDCHLIDDGRTLAITNGGNGSDDTSEIGQPSVTFVDVASEKLVERLVIPRADLNAGHVAISAKRDVVVVSAPREGLPRDRRGGLSLRIGSGSLATVSEPAEVVKGMIGETLSASIHEPTGIVGTTSPAGGQLAFWDMKSGKLHQKLDLPSPRGITQTLDGAHFVVSYGPALAALIHPSELAVIRETVIKTSITGSHLFTWDPSG